MIATVTRHTEIPAPFGKRAEFVMCRRRQMGDAAEIEARREDDSSPDLDSFVQPDESRALVSPVSNCITPDSKNHFLNICTEDSYGNAFPNRWIDTCVQLSPNVAHHVTIIVQKARLMCKFYDDSNGCSGNVRYITRTKDKPHRFEPPAEFGNDLKYALCRRGEWKRDVGELELETHDEDVTLDTTIDQSTRTDTNEVTTSTKTQYLLARISSDIASIELKENSCTFAPGSATASAVVSHTRPSITLLPANSSHPIAMALLSSPLNPICSDILIRPSHLTLAAISHTSSVEFMAFLTSVHETRIIPLKSPFPLPPRQICHSSPKSPVALLAWILTRDLLTVVKSSTTTWLTT
jgi:hypothetical protein